jgi:hypothetical protein
MAVVVSVPLNALFLLGTWRYNQLRLGAGPEAATAASFDAFFEKQAKAWNIPAEDALRVRSVLDTTIEDVVANANGPVEIQLGSDSFDVLATLRYAGNLPSLPEPARKGSWWRSRASSAGFPAISLACTPTASSGARRERNARSGSSFRCENTRRRRRPLILKNRHFLTIRADRSHLALGP